MERLGSRGRGLVEVPWPILNLVAMYDLLAVDLSGLVLTSVPSLILKWKELRNKKVIVSTNDYVRKIKCMKNIKLQVLESMF